MTTTTDTNLRELRERNEARAREAIAAMGARHLLHPANRVQRLPQPLRDNRSRVLFPA